MSSPKPPVPARRRGGGDAVHPITAVRRGLSEDVDYRQRRYLISMGVRTVCLVLAAVSGGWFRWAFLAAAVLLPYIAVVFANGGREPNRDLPTAFTPDARPALEAPRTPPDDVRPGAA